MKKNDKRNVVAFQYKFSPLMIVLSILVIVLCTLGIAVSVYRIVEFGIQDFLDALKSPFLILVCVFCIILVISILAKSQYLVDDKNFTVQFGFIKSVFSIKEITSLLLDSDSKKLTVYFGEQFSVLSIDPLWNDELIKKLREINQNIEFSFTLAEAPKDKK